MERRALVVVAVVAIGLTTGLAALASDAIALAVVVASLALVGGVAAWRLLEQLGRASGRIGELESEVTRLEDDVAAQTRSRAEAEEQLASRIQLTAMRRGTEGDALTDLATGLFSEGYFTVALEARIAAARRNLRPVAVVLMEVIEGLGEGLPRPAVPADVTQSIQMTLRESDTACRLLDGGYALVLEDTTENGAIWTVERIRRQMASDSQGLTMWAGVACYPAHGLTTEEVLDRADLALDTAREWRQDRIEVATVEP